MEKKGDLDVLIAGEVYNVEERLDLNLTEKPLLRQPSPLTRASGHLLLWTIAALVCYAGAA